MPPSNDRPWSTQYQDDYNKRKTKTQTKCWSNHQKNNSARKKTWGQVPMATAVTFTLPEQSAPYVGEISGMDDDVDLDFTVTGHQATLNTRDNIQQSTQTDPVDITCTDDIPKVPEAIDHSAPVEKGSQQVWNYHWSQWPEPKPPEQKRPHTSIGFHRPRPSPTADDITRSKSPDPSGYVGDEQQESKPKGQPMQFVPDFKSWINTINEYDKQEVANMLTTLYRSNTFHNHDAPTPPRGYLPQSPGRDTYTAYHGPRPSYANLNPTGFYAQSFYPHNQYGGTREDMYVQGFAKQMEGREPLPNIYTERENRYPLTSRRPKRPFLSEDYVHEHSMFMTTTPRVKGHFIIHPDWVSERSGLRRSLTSLTMLPKPKRQPRYGLSY